jgi:hypothetical protein
MATIDSNKVSMKDVQSGGHISGRDTTISNYSQTINNNAPVMYRQDPRIRELILEHEQEILADPSYKEFSEKLNNFLNRTVENELRDLQQKLEDGQRDFLVDYAMEQKESVTKKIMSYSHFTTAQEIYTFILANMRVTFLHQIAPKIKSSKFDAYEIDDLVVQQIIEPTLISLEGCSLVIDKDELYGLLYVLTGNCYIEWD